MRLEPAKNTDRTVRLSDYRPPDWLVDDVSLTFDLHPSATVVRSRIAFRRNPARMGEGPADLVLDGRGLVLRGAAINGAPVPTQAMTQDGEGLTVAADALPGDSFVWEAETETDPAANTALEGLYMSGGMYCTQCEAEGFRKITFYPDRPDVMAPYSVRIEADRAAAPVLLSNGNRTATGDLPGGRHFAEWHDPFPKPSYLFALVAGELVQYRDSFTTMSGREVALEIHVRPGDLDKCEYAMDSLKRAMRWDEETHGREYDLDLFMIVAVDDFNMGAMENKGLNIFNSKYVLASPATATDRDYELIEGIVAHEYFHNWTGNRITCRDWFQLCLKEGLTVFRDQEFSGDMRGHGVKRIDDVKMLRARQFREDQGPLAHPVRPEEYVEINNFYTATVYEKGAEVIRMLREIVGRDGYRKALDLYFQRHDGQACTIEDFRRCFEDACGTDLTRFARWWGQSGTPRVTARADWQDSRLTIHLSQSTPPTPDQPTKQPLVIPVAAGVIGPDGTEEAPTRLLLLDQAERSFVFEDVPEGSVPSLLRGFSAPVTLEQELDDERRAFLLAHDTDQFNRWEAARGLALRVALALIDQAADVPELWANALGRALRDESLDPAFRAALLDLPGDDELAREVALRGRPADPESIFQSGRAMRRALAGALADDLARLYLEMQVAGPYSPDAASAGRRALANRCMALLATRGTPEAFARAEEQFDQADNMSESLPALTTLVHNGAPGAAAALAAFYEQWKHDPLVVQKWLSVQATAPLDDVAGRVEALTEHAGFDWRNPNSFRSLIGAFAMANPRGFHAADGSGYRLVADWLIRLDAVNPQTTARIAGAFETWRRYDSARQKTMRGEMERILRAEGLSKNTREILERILGQQD